MDDNRKAVELLDEYVEAAQRAVTTAVWAQAYLTEGGEATWDAVKSVSLSAEILARLCTRVENLRERFEDIIP